MFDIVGYVYKAEQYTPAGIIESGIHAGWLSPGARGMSVEDALDQAAQYLGVERDDERTFDTDDFPKVILAHEVEGDDENFVNEHGHHVRYGDIN